MAVQDILCEVRSLGRITSSDDDDILEHYIEILISEARFYTKRPELTSYLEDLVISYTLKMYRADSLNSAKNVSNIKRGDTQTQFVANGNDGMEDLLNSFRQSMRSMKIIKGVC